MGLFPMRRQRAITSATFSVAIDAGAPSRSGWVTGGIALPIPAAWGDSAVPAGEYTLVVPSWAPLAMVYIQGITHDSVVFATSVEAQARSRTSELRLARTGTTYCVRSLTLGDPGLVLHFEPRGSLGRPPLSSMTGDAATTAAWS